MRKIRTALGSMAVLGGLLVVMPDAEATGVASVCVVDPGYMQADRSATLLPGPGGTFYLSVVITCPRVGSHAGVWTVNAAGTRDAGDSCAVGNGSGSITVGSEGPNGIVTGSLSFERVGSDLVLTGTASDSTGSHPFVADLVLLQTCPSTFGELTGLAVLR